MFLQNNKTVLAKTIKSISIVLALVLLASLSTAADRSGQSDGQQETIQRPHRTTSFVPRLGKREQIRSDRLLELICANYDCGQIYDSPLLALSNPQATNRLMALEPADTVALDEPFVQQLKRASRAPEESRANIMQDLLSGAKRVAFTPRIGRK